MPLKTDGARIRELRESKAMTLTEFAQKAGYALNSVHLIEKDKVNGGPKFIREAVRILGCKIEDITSGTVERKAPCTAGSPARAET